MKVRPVDGSIVLGLERSRVGSWATGIVIVLLPPANEVWGKVMFLHLSVCLFTAGGWSASVGGSASRGDWADPPPGYYGIWSTSILLECILVFRIVLCT